jgi:hypothetical protein
VKLQFNSVALVGTSRTVEFTPGLNVLEGPISTGKTSLMRLLAIVLGGGYDSINPEVDQSVSELAAQLVIGERNFAVVRRLVTTDTAPVQIAGDGAALRLPAMRADSTRPSYGHWLLDALGLPSLRVPQAPTRPQESAFIPVSINDYLRYCRLRQDEIDVDVLGSSQPFRDIKRRYVFRILYGGYDVEVAQLQDELRRTESELRQLEHGAGAFERFLAGTALENRAAINRELDEARARQAAVAADRRALAEQAQVSPDVIELRTRLAALGELVGDRHAEFENERASAHQLSELRNQLRTQLGRLIQAVVAGARFFDFDFVVCPRCGSAVDQSRGDETGHCYLCLQEPPPARTREDLIAEQDRVGAQILETEELISSHEQRAAALGEEIVHLEAERQGLNADLDHRLATFISAQADRIDALARADVEAAAVIERLEEYSRLFARLDEASRRIDELTLRRGEIEALLERAEQVDAVTDARIATLEGWFAHYVEALELPLFGGQPRAAIDRNDYQPIINGRKFPQLSAGVRVLVNIAHMLAHHRAALELGLPLPGLVMIDGINKNIGTAEYDATRVDAAWTQLIDLSNTLGEDLQLIVAANDVPDRARPFVRLSLTADNRLIPASDLAG